MPVAPRTTRRGITTGDQRRIAYQIMPLFRALKRQLLALGALRGVVGWSRVSACVAC
jgi:hypothetical protein